MELKGSKTEANLMTAFAGESQARNKYTYFASKARKEGYVQIAKIFEDTANNEKEHAKIWFKLLNGIGSTPETSRLPPRAKTTSGRICTRPLPRRQKPRASTTSPSCLSRLQNREGTRGPLQSAACKRQNGEVFKRAAS